MSFINIALILAHSRPGLAGFGIQKGTSSAPLTLSMKNGARKRKAVTTPASDTINSVFWEWVSHQDESFHDFPPAEAQEIRQLLLDWYRVNRRKLPWRGDTPPFDGSTAGIASKNAKKSTKSKKGSAKSQPSIKRFFAPTNSSQDTVELEVEKSEGDEALEVTGYGVWVSEIMLQQTRVEAVIPYYIKWMKRFPTVYDLAAASEDEVNSHWAGLGFYRRARLLHKGAKRVVEEYNGCLPTKVSELLKIDGIGRYTASAVASIAFDVCVPVVDGNVCRVLARLRGISNHIKAPILKEDVGWKLAEQIVKSGDGKHAGEVNQALMELGATYCSPTGSGIDDRDPLKGYYMSTKLGIAFAEEVNWSGNLDGKTNSIDACMAENYGPKPGGCACRVCNPDGIATAVAVLSVAIGKVKDRGDVEKLGHSVFPLPPPRKAKREEVFSVAAMSCGSLSSKDERWLLVKRPKDGLLAGQWEFPSVCIWSSANEEKNGKSEVTTRKASNQHIPNIEPRKRVIALNSFLGELSTDSQGDPVHSWVCQCAREKIGSSPLEHIFSHVRHTMWIEYGALPDQNNWDKANEWNTAEGREVRWMSEKDMKNVGVTSGVKKILKLVKANRK